MSSSAETSASRSEGNRAAALLAAFCALVMIAFQTASKVIRDTLFFESFEVTALPTIVICAAVASVAFAIPAGRVIRVLSPARIIPLGFLISAGLLMAEWTFRYTAPKVTAIALYLHFAALGAVLISGFWSLVNERFDAHTAKMYVSRIAGGATLGGLIGGVVAERLSGVLDAASVIPVLAAFHAACAVLTFIISRHHKRKVAGPAPTGDKTDSKQEPRPAEESRDDGKGESMLSGLGIVLRVKYLRNLAAMVLLTTTAAGVLDYVFKAAVVAEYVEKAERQRFFAIFYTSASLATFLLQALLGSRMLHRFGIAVTMGTLPVISGIGAVLNFVFPGVWTATVLRGGELALHSSLFRAGYEQHYTPIPPREKRPAKSVNDVVVDRTGDALGGGIISGLLAVSAAMNLKVAMLLVGVTIVLYVIAIIITSRLRAGYVEAIEKGLVDRAYDLETVDPLSGAPLSFAGYGNDSLTHAAVASASKSAVNMSMHSLQSIAPVPSSMAPGAPLGSEHNAATDNLVSLTADLRSRDPARVKRALKCFGSVDRPPVQTAVPLLAWDAVAPQVVAALRPLCNRYVGTLVDALLDEDEEFTVRRRVPRILAAATSQRAFDGLTRALADKRFEIRYRAANALVRIHGKNPEVEVNKERIYDAIRAAVASDARLVASRTIVDRLPDTDAPLLGEVLEERLDR
ncbi:MAG TPA: Npt1/Npt2 family nucleotide transporter, partial [Myxococcota bacterium]|nr:Npt1/Npt2 family nucleotide transporter [Myxococcota bacterium]